MSELYLVLRHRLDHVTDWVMVEPAVLREARKRLGLSYEAMARQLSVVSKTYERWEKAGRIPRTDLARVAEILELEIEQPNAPSLRITETWQPSDDLTAEIISRLDRIEKLLRDRPAS
jgi:transcriptional regulator with XRE-family HTH domain